MNGSTSGYAQIQAGATAANNTLTLPDGNATLVDTSSTQTLTNKTLTSPSVSNPTFTGTVTAAAITASGNVTVGGDLIPSSSFLRNRIINGAMQISQRGTSFSTPASGAYTIDRWFIGWVGAAPATVAQVSNSAGYRNALQATGAASNTVLSINQRIESYNCSDLSGATVTFQANITVSTPQTVSWSLSYPTAQDNYTSSTTISTGTWSATATATTFTATVTSLPAGAVNGLQLAFYPNNGGAFTSGTITITGVQLEVGSNATPFERRQYGTELMLCQRYYQQITGAAGTVGYSPVGTGVVIGATQGFLQIPFAATMRQAPSYSYTGSLTLNTGLASPLITSIATQYNGTGSSGFVLITCSAGGMTVGTGGVFYTTNATTNAFAMSSEL